MKYWVAEGAASDINDFTKKGSTKIISKKSLQRIYTSTSTLTRFSYSTEFHLCNTIFPVQKQCHFSIRHGFSSKYPKNPKKFDKKSLKQNSYIQIWCKRLRLHQIGIPFKCFSSVEIAKKVFVTFDNIFHAYLISVLKNIQTFFFSWRFLLSNPLYSFWDAHGQAG